MKDFLDQDLVVGDFVIFIRPNYRELCAGQITSFTAKNVHVGYRPHWRSLSEPLEDRLVDPSNLVKLHSTDALSLKLQGKV